MNMSSLRQEQDPSGNPQKGKAAGSVNRKSVAIGLAVLVVAAGGGWAFAKHQATAVAKDQIEGFLIRNDLRPNVAYDDISGSPFGSATLTGVVVRDLRGGTIAKAGAIEISDIEMKGGLLEGIRISVRSAEFPLLSLARQDRGDAALVQLIGMGYTSFTGDLSLAGSVDEKSGMLSFESNGDLHDFGSWKTKFRFGGITPAALGALQGLSQAARSNPAQMFDAGLAGLATLSSMTLAEADLTIDNTGYSKRSGQITESDLPPDETAQPATSSTSAFGQADELELVRAGIAPSEAKADRQAIETWLKEGGTIRIESNIGQPIALLTGGGLFSGKAFAFDTPAQYLAVTKSKISN